MPCLTSVVKVTVEKETYPVLLPSDNTPDDMKVTEYCKTVMENSGIVRLLIFPENLYPYVRNPRDSESYFGSNLTKYLKTIDYKDGNGAYLVGYFKDGSYANVKIFTDDKYAAELNDDCNPRIAKNYEIKFVNSSDETVVPSYKGTAGCGEEIDIEEIIERELTKSGDACLVPESYYPYIYVNPYNEDNIFRVLVGKKPSQVIIEYKDLSGSTIYPAVTLDLTCGNLVNPTSYIRKIEGYEYVKSNVGETVLDGTDLTITLSYNGG